MPNEERDETRRLEETGRPAPSRRATVVRALVMSALAAMAPAAGCYDSSDPGDDAGYDADAADGADTAVRDDGSVLAYGVPDYGVPDADVETGTFYGMPEYGAP